MNDGRVELFEALRRVTVRPRRNNWSVFVFEHDTRDAIAALVDAADALGHHMSNVSLEALLEHTTTSPDLVVVDARPFDDRDWSRLDLSRARLDDATPVVFVVDQRGIERLTRFAPNLSSIVGANLFEIAREHDSKASKDRLAELRAAHPESNDADLIERAQRSEALDDSEIEWLVLLGRADLL